MPSVVSRVIARVRALLPEDWTGAAGALFTKTVDVISETVSEVAPCSEDVPGIVKEGLQRYAVGKVSREHAEAERNYAEEEKVRIEAEFARRTMDARNRQEQAKADQEETRARTMHVEEAIARLKLLDLLEAKGMAPVRDRDGIKMVRVHSPEAWATMRDLLLKDIVPAALETKADSDE